MHGPVPRVPGSAEWGDLRIVRKMDAGGHGLPVRIHFPEDAVALPNQQQCGLPYALHGWFGWEMGSRSPPR